MSKVSALMTPGKIGALELRNRIIMAPMGSNLAQTDGHCGERIQSYYERRAEGGAGMVIVGVASITWPEGSCNPNQVAISDDCFIPGLQALTDRVHHHGCKAAVQLQHAGQIAVCDMSVGRPLLVPSLPKPKKEDMTQALTEAELATYVKSFIKKGAKIEYKIATKEELQTLVANFASAADRAKRAGFDGVEIHAGHGYILSSFLSPYSNQREDEYGGSLENRARLLVEVLTAIREKVGPDFAVWCRLDSKEFRLDGGITIEDAKRNAKIAEQAGADAIHVTAYANNASGIGFTEAPLVHQTAGFVEFAKAIKRHVSVPVIGVGRIEPELAEKLIAHGQLDFVAMARKLLADPDLPNKIGDNRRQDVRPCIYCYTCVSQIFLNDSICCAVNPFAGREYEMKLTPAAERKKILVVGGGPAGMEAARILTLRGHQVTLCERGKRLGGTVFFSSLAYPPNGKLVEQMEFQIRNMDIDIHLHQTVDREYVQSLNPDVVVIATGAKRDTPPIAGADQHHVFNGDQLRNLMTGEDSRVAKDKLSFSQRAIFNLGSVAGVTSSASTVRGLSRLWMPVGDSICVIGGGLVGVELAEFLVVRGRKVTVLEESDKLGVELSIVRRWRVLHELRESGAELITCAKVSSISADAVHFTVKDGPETFVKADSVIIAQGASGNDELSNSIKDCGIEWYQIGDCKGMAYIEGAISQATELGLSL